MLAGSGIAGPRVEAMFEDFAHLPGVHSDQTDDPMQISYTEFLAASLEGASWLAPPLLCPASVLFALPSRHVGLHEYRRDIAATTAPTRSCS